MFHWPPHFKQNKPSQATVKAKLTQRTNHITLFKNNALSRSNYIYESVSTIVENCFDPATTDFTDITCSIRNGSVYIVFLISSWCYLWFGAHFTWIRLKFLCSAHFSKECWIRMENRENMDEEKLPLLLCRKTFVNFRREYVCFGLKKSCNLIILYLIGVNATFVPHNLE